MIRKTIYLDGRIIFVQYRSEMGEDHEIKPFVDNEHGRRFDIPGIGQVNGLSHSTVFVKYQDMGDEPSVMPRYRAGTGAIEAPTDNYLRHMWRINGGDFHGPNVETGSMPEDKLLPFLRHLINRAKQ